MCLQIKRLLQPLQGQDHHSSSGSDSASSSSSSPVCLLDVLSNVVLARNTMAPLLLDKLLDLCRLEAPPGHVPDADSAAATPSRLTHGSVAAKAASGLGELLHP